MKKFLEENLKKEARELMEMQGLLKESDHENRQLNRQVLKLLQENTRLKMEKVQHSIVAMPTECRKTVQKICSKRIQEIQGRSKQKGEASPFGRMRISTTSGNTPAKGKQNKEVVSRHEEQAENTVFFTFGGSTRPPSLGLPRQSMASQQECKVRQQKIPPQQENGQKKQDKNQVRQQPSKQEAHSTPENHEKMNKKEDSCIKRPKNIHSIQPSPQITPKRDLNRQTTPTKSTKQLQPHAPESNSIFPPNSSIEKRRKYIDIVSVFLTPSRPKN